MVASVERIDMMSLLLGRNHDTILDLDGRIPPMRFRVVWAFDYVRAVPLGREHARWIVGLVSNACLDRFDERLFAWVVRVYV